MPDPPTPASAPAQPTAAAPATPSTPSRPIPRIIQTTPSQHVRRQSGSYPSPSPIDIKPKSPAARRMSMTTTSQSASINSQSAADRILSRPQTFLAGVMASLMLSGIIYSLIHSTSLNTSDIHHIHIHHTHPSRTAYFAQKSNILNTVFVKRAWGWTTLLYLSHLVTAPPTSTSRAGQYSRVRRIGVWLLATGFWLLFTRWFFGAGVGDRIIALTGGNCALPLPRGINFEEARNTFPTLFTSGEFTDKSSGRLYLPLPSEYCSLGSTNKVDSTSFPELFALLPSGTPDVAKATADHPSLQPLPRPRWHKGFDISGHAFLLTLSVMVLARELAPSWRAWSSSSNPTRGRNLLHRASSTGWVGTAHRVVTLLATALLGIWIWMILMTAVYFHNPPEKLSGLVLGLATSWIINVLISEPNDDISSTASFVPIKLFDENAARRGEVVDDGKILEAVLEDSDDGDIIHPRGEVDARGRLKGKVE